jgi:hypothetical protein
MSKKTVAVTLEVPEGLMQFLEDIVPSTEFETVQDYLKDAVIAKVAGDIEGEYFNPTLKNVAKKYNLKEEFDIKEADAE